MTRAFTEKPCSKGLPTQPGHTLVHVTKESPASVVALEL